MAVSVMYYGILGARVGKNMGSGFWVLGSGFWVLGSGCSILGSGFWVLGSGFWVLGSGYLFGAGWIGFKDRHDDEASGFQTPPTIVFWREENGSVYEGFC